MDLIQRKWMGVSTYNLFLYLKSILNGKDGTKAGGISDNRIN